MKSNLCDIKDRISSKDELFTQHIQDFLKVVNIQYSDDLKRFIKNIVIDCVLLRQYEQQEFDLMWKEAKRYSCKYKFESVFAKIRHLFAKLRRDKQCLCLDCITTSLENRNCGMRQLYNEKYE